MSKVVEYELAVDAAHTLVRHIHAFRIEQPIITGHGHDIRGQDIWIAVPHREHATSDLKAQTTAAKSRLIERAHAVMELDEEATRQGMALECGRMPRHSLVQWPAGVSHHGQRQAT
jgi:hypothetical protein